MTLLSVHNISHQNYKVHNFSPPQNMVTLLPTTYVMWFHMVLLRKEGRGMLGLGILRPLFSLKYMVTEA